MQDNETIAKWKLYQQDSLISPKKDFTNGDNANTFREHSQRVILEICDPCNLLLLVNITKFSDNWKKQSQYLQYGVLMLLSLNTIAWVSPGPLSLFSKAVWRRSLVKWLNHRAGSTISALHNSLGWNDGWLGGRSDSFNHQRSQGYRVALCFLSQTDTRTHGHW